MNETMNVGNFTSCCRLCLSEKSDSLRPVFDDATKDIVLAQKILTFLAVEITSEDKVSTMVCDSCILKVDDWNSYKDCCAENQAKLEQWLTSCNTSHMELGEMSFQIKEEPVDNEEEPQMLDIVEMDEQQSDELEIVNSTLPSGIRIKTEMEVEDGAVSEIMSQTESEVLMENRNGHVENNLRCTVCDKVFANISNRKRHERKVHSIDTSAYGTTSEENSIADDDGSQSSLLSQNSLEPEVELTEEEPIEKDNQKIQFAAGLQLLQRDSTPISMENLSKIELSYIEKCKAMVVMYRSLVCACHNVTHPNLKGLLSHLRSLRIWFPVFTCYNCMITFTDRSTSMKHLVRCPRGSLETITKLSNLRKRSEIKTRLYQNYKCVKCRFMFSFHEDYCNHVDEEHCDEEVPFTCLCGNIYGNMEDYKQHVYYSCLIQFYCDICFVTVNTVEEFTKHASELHDHSEGFVLLQDDDYRKRNLHKAVDIPNEALIVTGKRKSTFYTKSLLTVKQERVINPAAKKCPSACTICGRVYSNYHNMLRHYKTHIDGTANTEDALYCCPDCGVMCNKEEWEKHKKTHKAQKCTECGKVFIFQSELDQHRSVHLNLKVYRDSKTHAYKTTMVSPNSEEAITALNGETDIIRSAPSIKQDPEDSDVKRQYSCTPCNKQYMGYSGLWDHNRRKHGKTVTTSGNVYPKRCEECDREFSTGPAYAKHMTIHQKPVAPERLVTPKAEPGEVRRQSTKRKPTNDDGEDYFTCNKCFKVFATRSNLKNHMRSHGVSPKTSYGSSSAKKRKVYCDVCESAFDSSDKLRAHMAQEHDETDMNSVEDENSQGDVIFTCDICVKTFTTKQALKQHKEKHMVTDKDRQRSVYCKYCRIPFANANVLSKHMLEEHEEAPKKEKNNVKQEHQFACTVCKKVFLTATALCAHQGWHKRGKVEKQIRNQEKIFRNMVNNISKPKTLKSERFECPTCSLFLPNDTALQIHILEKHRNVNAFVVPRCTICNQDFETRDEYETHKRLHDMLEKQKKEKEKRSFPCKYCTASYTRPDNLSAHVRHFHRDFLTDQFKCKVCNRLFDKAMSLTLHMKVHEKQTQSTNASSLKPLFSCSICNMGFNLPKDLRTHTINAHPF